MNAKSKFRAVLVRGQRLRRHRSGLVLIAAALALTALTGMAALTVDLGRLAVAAQKAQNVADAAAMGAVYHMPDRSAARIRLGDVVAANNATGTWPTVTVAPTSDVTYYGPGEVVPNFGQLAGNQHAVTVVAHVNDQYSFARVAGLDEMNLQRSATAVLTMTNGRCAAIFAFQDAVTEEGFVSSGGGVFIDGDVHSNSNVDLRGSDYTITGQVRYRWNLWVHKNVVMQGGSFQIGASEPYPVGPPWNQSFAAVCSQFNQTPTVGSVTFQKDAVLSPGLYLIDGNVTFNGSGHVLDGVTLVASGKITFNGAASVVSPAVEGMGIVAYAASEAIVFNGATQVSSGTVFAPNGRITYHGSNSYNSSLIGYQVIMRGGDYTVRGSPDPEGAPRREVRLVY